MRRLELSHLLLTIIAVLILASCSSGSGVTQGDMQNHDQHDLTQGLLQIKMNPAPIQTPPFADSGLGKVASSPAELDAQLPPLRLLSYNEADLMRDGSSFDNAAPNNLVAPMSLTAVFSPMWMGDGSTLSDAAYAIYRFPLSDYGMSGQEQTLGFSWVGVIPPDDGDLWVGFGNVAGNHWDWYKGEQDNVLTIPSYTPYEFGDGSVLCAIVLLGQTEMTLDHLQIGQFEMRGTGAEDESPNFQIPPSSPLPDFPLEINLTVDLSSGCAPIGDQGSTGSCTAFATANGAVNYMMNSLYGDCGWNFDNAFNRASPRFVYNQTGADFGAGCPTAGRNTSDVGSWLLTNGAATEFNAPIGPVSPSAAYNCGTSWSSQALVDASVMHPTEKHFIGTYDAVNERYYLDDADINTVRSILRVCRIPVVFRTNLDNAFWTVNYAGGDSWTYSGPSVGGHAMMIVGYDDDRDGGSFKVRNSWGTGFGVNGYVWITYASMQGSAGVYAFYLVGTYTQAAEERFCPSPPVFLPPPYIEFNPLPGPIVFNFDPIPGVERFIIYKDNPEEPYGFVSQKNEVDPLTYEDLQADDYFTHVFWIRAVGGQDESPLSRPFFCWKVPMG